LSYWNLLIVVVTLRARLFLSSAPFVKVDIPLPPVLIILVLPRTKNCAPVQSFGILCPVASLLTLAAFVKRCYPGCSSTSEG